MNIPHGVVSEALNAQLSAAHDPAETIRVVAGPGTGKSRVISERVAWLVSDQACASRLVFPVSFTRASAADLEREVNEALTRQTGTDDGQARATTLHSLALRILRAAGRLDTLPVLPPVLDEWEMTAIFDAEFEESSGIHSKQRTKDIRLEHEAYWSTETWTPPGLPVPAPPVSLDERTRFTRYYQSRGALYGYLLPSDITRQCLQYLKTIPEDSALPFRISHLIVDEYQDLNPVDIDLIKEIRKRGTSIYAVGDDDQSIYFFRYALPTSIQRFDLDYPGSSLHTLEHCFRCPEEILNPAQGLLERYGTETRIPKTYVSLPTLADPRVGGSLYRWAFRGPRAGG